MNFSKISDDTGVSSTTIREYYQILEDTLIGSILLPWKHGGKRKPIATSKFYFFDTGVCHMLTGTQTIDRNSDLFGKSFEHWVYMELYAYNSYHNLKKSIFFWRSQDHYEVDFILNEKVAIEVKATKKISKEDFRGINALKESIPLKYYIVSNDPVDVVKDGVSCLHWRTFMERLWKNQIVN